MDAEWPWSDDAPLFGCVMTLLLVLGGSLAVAVAIFTALLVVIAVVSV